MKWTEQELNDFCIAAIELLNSRRKLKASFVECRLFENSSGSIFHITYSNEFLGGKYFSITTPGKVLSEKSQLDKIAGLGRISDLTKKITLRIAWLIYNDYRKRVRK